MPPPAGQPHLRLQEVIRWAFTSEDIISVETLRWSWSALEPWQWRILLIGIPIFGCLRARHWARHLALRAGSGVTLGVFWGVADTLFWGPVRIPGGALASSEIETKTVPNEGIRRSARNALRTGLAGGLIGGLAGGLLAGLGYGLGFKPITGRLTVLGFG